MNDRHTVDTITDDALDQLYVELGQLYKENAAAVTALADMARKRNEQMDRADRAEAALDRVRHLAERWRYTGDRKEGPLRELRQALDHQPAPAPAATEATSHVYLSTGCFHGHHDYCQSHTGRDGSKTPAQCKFCSAPCTCGCHQQAGPA